MRHSLLLIQGTHSKFMNVKKLGTGCCLATDLSLPTHTMAMLSPSLELRREPSRRYMVGQQHGPGGCLSFLCGAKDTRFLLLWKLWQGLLFQRARHALVSWECRAPSPDLPSHLDTHKSPSQASSPLPCISISLAVFHRRQRLLPSLSLPSGLSDCVRPAESRFPGVCPLPKHLAHRTPLKPGPSDSASLPPPSMPTGGWTCPCV